MAEIVRAALVQQRWTGDKDSMIKAVPSDRPGRVRGRAGRLPAGAVLRPVLLPGAGRRSTTPTPRRSRTGPTTELMRDVARRALRWC